MAPVTDEQFFFAIIKQLNGGIDWQLVADECGIVSKGAAAKRFSRMKNKHEAGGNGGGDATPADDGTPAAGEDAKKPTKKKAAAKKTSPKKRKLSDAADDNAQSSPVKAEEGDEA